MPIKKAAASTPPPYQPDFLTNTYSGWLPCGFQFSSCAACRRPLRPVHALHRCVSNHHPRYSPHQHSLIPFTEFVNGPLQYGMGIYPQVYLGGIRWRGILFRLHQRKSVDIGCVSDSFCGTFLYSSQTSSVQPLPVYIPH